MFSIWVLNEECCIEISLSNLAGDSLGPPQGPLSVPNVRTTALQYKVGLEKIFPNWKGADSPGSLG